MQQRFDRAASLGCAETRHRRRKESGTVIGCGQPCKRGMKKGKKKIVMTMAACALIGAMAFGGTMAYLTDNEGATNTFTVGKAQIDLTEPNYPGNDDDKVKDLIPNEEVDKDPQVVNTGANDVIVFMTVEVPRANVTMVADDGTKGTTEIQDLFWLKDAADAKNVHTNKFSDKWMRLSTKETTTDDVSTYVFAYKTAVAKDGVTEPLFDKVQLKNVIETEIDASTLDVVVKSYAIQASEILGADGSDLTAALTQKNLEDIYDIYFRQNEGAEGGGSEGGGSEGGNTEAVEAMFDTGEVLSVKMKKLSGDSSPTSTSANTTIVAVRQSSTAPDLSKMTAANVVSAPESEMPIYMWFDNGTIFWWSEDKTPMMASDSSCMFYRYNALNDINGLADWDAQNVTNMHRMFGICSALNDISALASWDIRNVTDMSYLFNQCKALNDISALANWNTGNVTNMIFLFEQCEALSDISALKNWDTGNVTNMTDTFADCGVSDLDPLKNWNTGNVTSTSCMFAQCKNLSDLSPLSGWNTANLTIANTMFSGCEALTNISALANWNTGKITRMDSMFSGCKALNDISGLSNWDTGNVIEMEQMFMNCKALSDISPLSNWNTGNVTNMSAMFSVCSLLSNASPINDWDILKVTSFSYMFNKCPSHPNFTKRVGTWDSNGTFNPTK